MGGEERYRGLSGGYLHIAAAVIIVYDVSNAESFRHAEDVWFQHVKQHAQPNAIVMLLGNKSDVSADTREVSYAEGVAVAKKLGHIPFMECSSLSGENLENMFNLAVHEVKRSIDLELMDGIVTRIIAPPPQDENDGLCICAIM
jgi:GTPase SAR1 family protein